MENGNWFHVISSLNFGSKLIVHYFNSKEQECCWNGLRLIPAATVCAFCGKDWHVTNSKKHPLDADTVKYRMEHMLRGECYHCGMGNQPKAVESPVKSGGLFPTRMGLHFRVATSKGMIRTVCVDSLRKIPVEK